MNQRKLNIEDINIKSVILDVFRHFWIVILVAVSFWMLVCTYERVAYHPEYTSSVTFAVSTKSSSTAVSNLNLTKGLAEVFSTVFESDVLKGLVANELHTTDVNYDVKATIIPETNLLKVSIVSDSPAKSFRALKATIGNYSTISEYMFQNAVLTVIKEPNVPLRPSNSLSTSRLKKEAAAGGAILAILVIAILSAMRETVQTRHSARHNLEGTMFGSISHDEKKHVAAQQKNGLFRKQKIKAAALITNPLVSYHFQDDCYRISSRIEQSMKKRDEKILLLTSAGENEGKSTVAANIALSLVSKGKKVLLIDCDFRKPALHKIFEVTKEEGTDFALYLLHPDQVDTSNMIVTKQNIDLLVDRKGHNVPQKLILTGRMKHYLETQRDHYDYIIIDSPPMLVASDAEALCEMTDTSMMVVRQDWALIGDINDCIADLQKAKARYIGYVLNNFATKKRQKSSVRSTSEDN